jgi:two-component system, OmpR family, response regulator QseB
MNIIFAENDKLFATTLIAGLKTHHYENIELIESAHQAFQTLLKIKKSTDVKKSVLVIDTNVSDMPMTEFLKDTRAKGIKTPILIISSNNSVEECVTLLDQGADDYMRKPFDLSELCARLRAIQRKKVCVSENLEEKITWNDITLDPVAFLVTRQDKSIKLSRREFFLFKILLENVGKVLTREKIAQTLYSWGDHIDSNALEVHIHNIRKKLGDESIIQTIRGIGYVIRPIGQQ